MKARKLNPMKTYKFKLYSNHRNRELHQTIDGHAHVWNHCVALQRRYYAIYGKYISKFRLINHISKLKRLAKFAHWHHLPSQSIQDVASRIDKGYKAMFEARAKGNRGGDLVLSLDANTSHSHCFKLVGNCLTVTCLLYTSPSPRDGLLSRMPSSA